MTLLSSMRVMAGGAALLALGGCASLNSLTSDVRSYGTWPAGRAPGTYVFERLPSQASQPEQQAALEDAARPAVEMAGFKPATDAGKADVTIQLGARITRYDTAPWDDPFWWNYGYGFGRFGGWRPGLGLGYRFDNPRYEREVAVLIRDRASGAPLYESRAVNDSLVGGDPESLSLMYEAALKDFPTPAVSPRRVVVPANR
ncbi:DUF4136 domain-containing protein [Aquincola tertiaricarbonis]|uniref:DUF4136 domain-containing protein n=1 Tax=Aquincola tertiaricarbonis TaxID=391953 RepID=A0ABY4S8Z7_AQUTE|nr:DUF4136 domain-containing protein [Aquincola tertiaricarbonis]URI09826.1 DUF4136 domain-containing protein [Aquincola tertiaricarbonis]